MRNRFGRAVKRWTTALLLAAGLLGATGSAQAVLQARDLTGDTVTDAYYDTVLNITWLKDANYAQTSGFDADGLMSWSAANSWAAGLVFAGYDDWRLPYASVNAGAGPISTLAYGGNPCGGEVACRDNEMAYMFYYNLNGTFGQNKTGTQTALGGEVLTGIQPRYWSGTEWAPGDGAWSFFFDSGFQSTDYQYRQFSAWAVRPGDVAVTPIPEPEIYAMLGVGLGLLGWVGRRKKLQAAA